MVKAWEYFESLSENVSLWARGDEWIIYGAIIIASTDQVEYKDRKIDRIGVNFSKKDIGEYFSSVPWISLLAKSKRFELYNLLKRMEIEFFEREKHFDDGLVVREEIQIGNPAKVIISFDLDSSRIYNIFWFKNGFDEEGYPYKIEIIYI